MSSTKKARHDCQKEYNFQELVYIRERKHFHDEIYVNERFMKITHNIWHNIRRRRGCIYNIVMPGDRICQKLLFIRSFHVHGLR